MNLDEITEYPLKTNYIKKYKVNNFRLLENVPEIELRPFTFIFGSNGSGKSSLLQSFDLFKQFIQTYDSQNRKAELNSNINLGGYSDIVSFNKEELSISYEFAVRCRPHRAQNGFHNISSEDIELKHQFYETPEFLDVMFIFRKHSVLDDCIQLAAWEIIDSESGFYYYYEDNVDGINGAEIRLARPNKSTEEFPFDELTDSELELLSRIYSLYFKYTEVIRTPFDPGIEEIEDADIHFELSSLSLTDKNHILSETNRILNGEHVVTEEEVFEDEDNIFSIRKAIDSADYFLGPYYDLMRKAIKKTFLEMYHIRNVRNEFPRNFGKGERHNSPEDKDMYNELISIYNDPKGISKLNSMIKSLGFGDRIELVPAKGVYQAFILKNNGKVNITDMSSGFKQLFPILLKSVRSYDTNLFLIEQPELHLHPKLQIDLIRILGMTKCTKIIETHSEHLIRKIQIMIARGELRKEDVAVYFMDTADGSAEIKSIKIEDNGMFSEPWPNGFFDDSYNLSMELLTARRN